MLPNTRDSAMASTPLNTGILFQLMLRWLKPALICDVGSRDGAHARRFSATVPRGKVVAFEASPVNAAAMRRNARLRARGIEVRECVVGDRDGTVPFFVEQPDKADTDPIAWGLSSTRRRRDEYRIGLRRTEIQQQAQRLDSFISGLDPPPATVAVWIDAEGAAYEVLSGMAGIRDRVQLVHVEVEDREIWHGQRLEPEVRGLLTSWGFHELARGPRPVQHDVVFVREELTTTKRLRLRAMVAAAALFSRFVNMIRER